MDAGAAIAIAPAQGLDGAFSAALSRRSAFKIQASAALKALASELSIPLLIASRAGDPRCPGEPLLRPYLLHAGEVRELQNDSIVTVGGASVYINVGGFTSPPAGAACDLIAHLPEEPWSMSRQLAWRQKAQQESQAGATLIIQGLGYAAGRILGGGSVAAGVKGAVQLPLFREADCTWDTMKRQPMRPAEQDPALSAICFCLRSICEQRRYEGIAAASDKPLLLALARLAVGAAHTWSLGERSPLASHHTAANTGLLSDSLLTLNPLTLTQLLLGDYAPPAVMQGICAPLSDLYDSEIAHLQQAVLAKLPEHLRTLLPPAPALMPDTQEQALRLLVDEHRSPVEIAARQKMDEDILRRYLRRLNQSSTLLLYGQPERIFLFHPERTLSTASQRLIE